jgi:UDP-N-acetylmuramoyl-tripeptide--D-alanyl-D-alanine ligase
VAGRHNVCNALAAATCALAAGAPLEAIVRGLQAFEPVAGRSRALVLERAGRRCTLVDDSYNANPDSVLAAIEVLAELPGPRWLLLGDMGEVGAKGAEFHAEVGAKARERGIDHFWAAGSLCAHAAAAYGPGARHFASADAALAALSDGPEAASVLVKGSRFMKMERLVQAMKTQHKPPEAACS